MNLIKTQKILKIQKDPIWISEKGSIIEHDFSWFLNGLLNF